MTVTKRDLWAILSVLAAIGLMVAHRYWQVEPREMGALCLDLSKAPFACRPRAGLLWLQHWQLWGAGAVALGLWAFLGAPLAVRAAAVALGVIAVLNFNATWGMIGAALGAWAWVEAAARRPPTPGTAKRRPPSLIGMTAGAARPWWILRARVERLTPPCG